VTSNGIKTALDGKQNTLTFDTAPTANSTNPVTSGGVKTALDGKSDVGHTHSTSDITDFPTIPTDVVKYVPQSLSSAEKEQACTNIGAAKASVLQEVVLAMEPIKPTWAAYTDASGYGSYITILRISGVSANLIANSEYQFTVRLLGRHASFGGDFTIRIKGTVASATSIGGVSVWCISGEISNPGIRLYKVSDTVYELAVLKTNKYAYAVAKIEESYASGNCVELEKITNGTARATTDSYYADVALPQADWNETNSNKAGYIKNKPTIPSAVTDAVRYSAQSLTDAQKTQARQNIDAAEANHTHRSFIVLKYDVDDGWSVVNHSGDIDVQTDLARHTVFFLTLTNIANTQDAYENFMISHELNVQYMYYDGPIDGGYVLHKYTGGGILTQVRVIDNTGTYGIELARNASIFRDLHPSEYISISFDCLY